MALLLIQHGIRAVAERQGISLRTVRRRFLELGVPMREHVTRVRRNLTLQLLRADLSIAAVARRLGFSSPKTFARFVRRQFGLPPSKLRRRLLNEQSTRSGR